jgi:hypothetical protein
LIDFERSTVDAIHFSIGRPAEFNVRFGAVVGTPNRRRFSSAASSAIGNRAPSRTVRIVRDLTIGRP